MVDQGVVSVSEQRVWEGEEEGTDYSKKQKNSSEERILRPQ